MNYEEITDQELLQRIGSKLKEIRLEQNIRQKELAEKVGLSMFSISQMETGHNTSMQSIIQVLRALGRMDMLDAFLLYNKEEENPLADRQRVSRVAFAQKGKPMTYAMSDEDEALMMAAESEEGYGYNRTTKESHNH